jgi:hypothetical protein
MVGLARLEDGDGQRQSILVGGRGEIVRVGVMTCGSKVGYSESKSFRSSYLFGSSKYLFVFCKYLLRLYMFPRKYATL